MSGGEELEVSVSAVVEAEEVEEVDDPLVPVGEDELENLEPENEGVVFVITTGQSRRQSRKSNKTNQSETRFEKLFYRTPESYRKGRIRYFFHLGNS